MSTQITHEEWMAAMNKTNATCSDALTVGQWSEKIGRCRANTSALVKDGLANGWMERAMITVESVTGSLKRVTGFRLSDKAKK